MDLGSKGKTALVLGASQGLGEAIAEKLAAEGANAVIAARNLVRWRHLAAQITSL